MPDPFLMQNHTEEFCYSF